MTIIRFYISMTWIKKGIYSHSLIFLVMRLMPLHPLLSDDLQNKCSAILGLCHELFLNRDGSHDAPLCNKAAI